VGTFEKDFTRIVSPELAQDIMSRLRHSEIVEFPNRYELSEVKGNLADVSWADIAELCLNQYTVQA
jgi:hypothetical protein